MGPETHQFSEDRKYRYTLWRRWDEMLGLPYLMTIGLNPSTADEVNNDPTVSQVVTRAKRLGFGALCMTNLFGFRATDPKDMKAQTDPTGPDNDRWLLEVAKDAGMILAAWGSHGSHLGRSSEVRELLSDFDMHCLAINDVTGEPGHPLYRSYDLQPFPLPD